MSLFSTFSISIGGLQAQSTALSGISNDLANTSTTAYKATSTSFETLVNDDSVSDSENGVSAAAVYANDIQGTITASDVSTYLAISGSGYFPVTTAITNGDSSLTFSSDTYYTRCGDFTVDAGGYLVNNEGYYLMGWVVDTEGNVGTDLTPIQLSELTNNPVATTQMEYAANLPASMSAGHSTTSSSQIIYDSLGNQLTVSYGWTKTASENTWDLAVSVADSDGASLYSATAEFAFGSDGEMSTISSTDCVTNGTSTLTFAFTPTDGSSAMSATCDFTGTTQFADSASSDVSVTALGQNGVAAGSFEDVAIDEDGLISIDYTNGTSITCYEVPIAVFNNANGLEMVDGNAYKETLKSGDVTYATAGTNGAGKITVSSLEASTVDIATEFTSLITAQRIYSANARVVTTIDQMLQTTVQI